MMFARSRRKLGLIVLSLAILALSFTFIQGIMTARAVTDNPVMVTRTGCPNAQNCAFGEYPTESSFMLPFTQQKIFQNPRHTSHGDFYMFYSTNMSLPGSGCTSSAGATNLCYECVYAFSPDGAAWRVNQTIGSEPPGLGNSYINCSAAYYNDTANNQLIVYLVAARNAGSANINHNIEFVIGTVQDSADAITWGPIQTVSASSSTQNFQFPVLQVDPNGYLQLAYSWVDKAVNRQTVDLCSSRVAHPVSNSSWTCNGGNNNALFNAQTQTGQTAASYMPHLQPVPGHSVMVLQGPCDNIATSACTTALSHTENATLVDWDGTTQTFTSLPTFTYPVSSPSDRRSSTSDPSTGTIYVAYHNGTDQKYWIRSIAKPYTSWTTPIRITGDGGEGRILLLTGTGTPETLVLVMATDQPKTVSGGGGSGTCGTCPSINVYTNSPSMSVPWSAAMTLYSNTTWPATWANAPWIVNTSTSNKLPIMWEQHVCGFQTNVPCTSQPEQLWFDPHTLYTIVNSQLKASFTYTPSSPTTGQTVTFTASASGGSPPYSYTWNFGDGSSGTGASMNHTFSQAGSYTVTLTVKDSGSPQQTTSSQQTISITNPTTPPSVAFTFSPASPDAGQSTSFTATASGGTAPYSYSWIFSDNGSATGSSVSHTFTTAGNYSAKLTVTDSAGSIAQAFKTLIVNPQVSGSFTYSPSNPLPLLQVTFRASAAGGSQPYSYNWILGDGTTGTGQTINHSYLLPGTYTVTLAITDANGQTFTTSQTLTVLTNLA